MADFVNPLVIVYFDIDYEKKAKNTNYWRNRILKIAKSFNGINFAMSHKDDFHWELGQFSLDPAVVNKPVVIAYDAQGKHVGSTVTG